MEALGDSSRPRDEDHLNRIREGFNEFFDWHMRGHIEYV
jgi:hypothetical protein